MNNLKPFDLERALAGDEVCMADGTPVTQLHLFDAGDSSYPLIGVVRGKIESYTKQGCALSWKTPTIFMKPKKKCVWVNLYPKESHEYSWGEGVWYDDEETANAANPDRIGGKAFMIEVEE